MAKFGWYSEKQRGVSGYAYYRTPAGQTVTITCTSTSVGHHGTAWDDIEFVSEVTTEVHTFWHGDWLGQDVDNEVVTSAPPLPIPEAAIPRVEPPKICSYCYSGMPPCTCGKKTTTIKVAGHTFDRDPRFPPRPRENDKL